MTRSRLLSLARVLVSLALCGWLVWHISWPEQVDAFGRIAGWVFLVALVGRLGCYLLVSKRLQILMRATGSAVRYWPVMQLTFIGAYAGNFLPSTVGGDAVRATFLKRHGHEYRKTVPLLVGDRMLNLFAVLLLGLCVLFVPDLWRSFTLHVPTVGQLAVGVIAIAAMTLLLAGLICLPRLRDIFAALRHETLTATTLLARRPIVIAACLGLSLLSEATSFGTVYLLADGVGTGATLLEVFAVMALVQIIVLLPVTINGIGLQEAGFVVLLTQVGVTTQLSLTVAILVRMIALLTTLPGLLYLLRGKFRGPA
ncbi:MAG: flippase-like domain-containing protein [Rhodospirillales bacterium]|nr:flippase-like domain-containing protein [Rhodospirillales bacterium]